jgi:hypothetical protein
VNLHVKVTLPDAFVGLVTSPRRTQLLPTLCQTVKGTFFPVTLGCSVTVHVSEPPAFVVRFTADGLNVAFHATEMRMVALVPAGSVASPSQTARTSVARVNVRVNCADPVGPVRAAPMIDQVELPTGRPSNETSRPGPADGMVAANVNVFEPRGPRPAMERITGVPVPGDEVGCGPVVGVGDGDAPGVAVGVGLGLGDGVGDGEGEGVGLGVGVGPGEIVNSALVAE